MVSKGGGVKIERSPHHRVVFHKAPEFTDGHPTCFVSVEQYRYWKEAARSSSPGANGYCADCLPDYKLQVKREGRCAHLGVRFRTDADGFLEGRRPEEERRRERKPGTGLGRKKKPATKKKLEWLRAKEIDMGGCKKGKGKKGGK